MADLLTNQIILKRKITVLSIEPNLIGFFIFFYSNDWFSKLNPT